MARPKKSAQAEMATIKIESTFWKLLETEKYSDITVLRIAQESGVNRNSFYYHYKDMDDLAYQAFKNNAETEPSRQLIATLLSIFQTKESENIPAFDLSVLPHSKRIMLCARSESSYLKQLVSAFLKEIWLNTFSIKEELLTLQEKLQINFIITGIIATLGSEEIKESPLLMLKLAQTEMGKAMVSTLETIAAAQKNLTTAPSANSISSSAM